MHYKVQQILLKKPKALIEFYKPTAYKTLSSIDPKNMDTKAKSKDFNSSLSRTKPTSIISHRLKNTINYLFNKFFICCKESRIESPNSFYGCFYIGPFEESLCQTLALNIRRTLLSELAGLAITAVEIDGVLHKFSSIPGVQETVLDIICNLQNLVFKKVQNLLRAEPLNTTNNNILDSIVEIAYLRERGPRVIKASDILLPTGIQCVNPDQYIATLAEDGSLNMKIYFNQGKSFIKQKPKNLDFTEILQRNHIPKLQPNLQNSLNSSFKAVGFKTGLSSQPIVRKPMANKIFLDSVFMPVTKVNAMVQESIPHLPPQVFSRIEEFEQTSANSTTDFVNYQPIDISKKSRLSTNINKSEKNKTKAFNKKSRTYFNSNLGIAFLTKFVENIYAQVEGASLLDIGKRPISKKKPLTLNKKSSYNKQTHKGLQKTFFKNTNLNGIDQKQEVDPLSSFILLSNNNLNKIHQTRQCHIILEIWTNGSIHPREALTKCLEFLAKTFVTLDNVKILGSMFQTDITYGKVLYKNTNQKNK